MATLKELGTTYGSQFIAKGLERLYLELDKISGMVGPEPHKKLSMYLNVVGGLGLPFVADALKVRAVGKEVAEIIGGHMFSQVWDYIEQYLTPPAAAVRTVTPTAMRYAVETPGGAPEFYPPLYGRKVSPEPVIKNHVRYTLE